MTTPFDGLTRLERLVLLARIHEHLAARRDDPYAHLGVLGALVLVILRSRTSAS